MSREKPAVGGEPIEITTEPLGLVSFATEAGETYELKKV
jgi:hypothetical protein